MKITIASIGVKEPKPRKIKIPTNEPVCKVGIVLAEDSKKELFFRATKPGYSIKIGTELFRMPQGKRLRVSVTKLGVELEVSPGIRKRSKKIEIVGGGTTIQPKAGVEFERLVAGRGFHWQKEVSQILPGEFEFSNRSGCLILVNRIPLEAYIACVLTSEMGANCPSDFVKAQAVAARSWAMAFLGYKHPGQPYSICNDDCCQRYQGTTFLTESTNSAVRATRGHFLGLKGGFVCASFYSKSCGGYMDCAQDIFGFKAPATTPKPDSIGKSAAFCSDKVVHESKLDMYLGKVDSHGKYFRWQYNLDSKNLTELFKNKLKLRVKKFVSCLPLIRTTSGRISRLRIDFVNMSGKSDFVVLERQYLIRFALHEKFLLSSAFSIKTLRDKKGYIEKLVLSGQGWGHGIGLCQIGAVGMALKGFKWRRILAHYYDQAKLVKSY